MGRANRSVKWYIDCRWCRSQPCLPPQKRGSDRFSALVSRTPAVRARRPPAAGVDGRHRRRCVWRRRLFQWRYFSVRTRRYEPHHRAGPDDGDLFGDGGDQSSQSNHFDHEWGNALAHRRVDRPSGLRCRTADGLVDGDGERCRGTVHAHAHGNHGLTSGGELSCDRAGDLERRGQRAGVGRRLAHRGSRSAVVACRRHAAGRLADRNAARDAAHRAGSRRRGESRDVGDESRHGDDRVGWRHVERNDERHRRRRHRRVPLVSSSPERPARGRSASRRRICHP